jgi:hypothetical protein
LPEFEEFWPSRRRSSAFSVFRVAISAARAAISAACTATFASKISTWRSRRSSRSSETLTHTLDHNRICLSIPT